jgi:hypothetical protein
MVSDNLESPLKSFLGRRMTPWHIHRLAVNISRQEAYERQCEVVRAKGIEVIEVRTAAPRVGPNNLERGPSAYYRARETALQILSKGDF